uniref:Uncharacterized protein n=1 Tax=Romanomermis culicivorax TaxID=13658 RepID=A0A915K6J2_ROMCU
MVTNHSTFSSYQLSAATEDEICTIEEIEILKPLEETYPIKTTIVPMNSLLTCMDPFKIQDFLLKYHFHKET